MLSRATVRLAILVLILGLLTGVAIAQYAPPALPNPPVPSQPSPPATTPTDYTTLITVGALIVIGALIAIVAVSRRGGRPRPVVTR